MRPTYNMLAKNSGWINAKNGVNELVPHVSDLFGKPGHGKPGPIYLDFIKEK